MEKSFKQLESYIGKRILFVGVGNILRSDDGIGVYIVNRIVSNQTKYTLNVEVSLENYISTINKISPDVLILVDCIDFKQTPGYFNLLPIKDITETIIHSHHITLSRISDFFKMPVLVLGIQPESLRVGEKLTERVKEAGNRIISHINSVYSESSNFCNGYPIIADKPI
jgi:hydrogenase 3 maturation protease